MKLHTMGWLRSLSMVVGVVIPAVLAAQPGDFVVPPDYEQVRPGLPATVGGTAGGAYCGPSSAADLMQWLDDNGFPEIVFPDITFADVTNEIFQLGLYLSTDPDGGTTPEGFVSGLQDYLDDAGLGGRLEVSYVGRNMGSAIEQALGHSFGTISLLLNVGHLAIARVGWYQSDGIRCKGHYVTMTGYDFVDGSFVSRFRDPADDAYQVRTKVVADDFYDLQDPTQDGCPNPCIRNQFASSWQWNRAASASCDSTMPRTGIQDGIVSIGGVRLFSRPGAGGGLLTGYNMASLQNSSHNSSTAATVTSIAPQPHLLHLYHCGPSANAIYKTDFLTNAVDPIPISASLNQPRRLAFGSGLKLYVLQGATGAGSVLALDANGNLLGQQNHPSLAALTYWEKNDQVILWSGSANQIAVCSADLMSLTPISLPSGPTFVDPGYMVVDPNGDLLYYNHNGSSSIFRYNLATQTSLTPLSISGLSDPGEMVVDNRGHLYVAPAVTGPVRELDANGMVVTSSPAASFLATNLLAIARAIRRPLVNDYAGGATDADRPIDLGDFDADVDVDGDDFERFYNCFSGAGVPYTTGMGCIAGDFDGDSDIDCADYTGFAAQWSGSEPLPIVWDCRGTTAVPNIPVARLQLEAHPNPFNPRTVLSYEIALQGHAELVVFDVRGRRVRTLIAATRPAGTGAVVWDGRDDEGRELAAGIYTARLSAQGETHARKLVLTK